MIAFVDPEEIGEDRGHITDEYHLDRVSSNRRRKRPNRKESLSWWDKYWPRVVAIIQTTVGSYGFVFEVHSGGDRPYVILGCMVALGLVPATLLFEKWLKK